MKSKGLFRKFGILLVGSLISFSSTAQDSTDVADKEEMPVIEADAGIGREYFEGSKGFANGGPACITCHNVNNDELLIPGGLLGKDLTSAYDTYQAALSSWLDNPDNGPMTVSYQNHKLDEVEREHLSAFLKHASEVKDTQQVKSRLGLFLVGGGGGLVVILILISLLWMKRKKQMVKKDIFARQNSAWDAKH